MKKGILLFLLVIGVISAQGQSGVVEALTGLCTTAKSMVSIFGTFCCIGGLIPFIIGAVLYYFKKESRGLKITGIVLLVLGGIALILAALSFAIYLFTPFIIKAILGSDITVVC